MTTATGGGQAASIPTLTDFQFASMRDAANSSIDLYLLMRPHILDGGEQYVEYVSNNIETDELLELGLLEDVSERYAERIRAERQVSGRVFRVIRITAQGKAMFNESDTSALSI
jgi:hypothetical protein